MKTRFTPMPVQALQDDKLSAVDLRVLGAVAYHDRLDKNSRGCFASQATLATMARCDIRSVKRSLQHLKGQGHIKIEKNEKDGRQRVYRVIYEIGDKTDTHPEPDRGQIDTKIGDKVEKKRQQDQHLKGGKHKSKQILLNVKANPEESAPFPLREIGAFIDSSGRLNLGGFLAWLERTLAANDSDLDLPAILDFLENKVAEGGEYGDPNIGRAERLLYAMEERASG